MLETLNEITLLVDEPLKNVTFTKTGGPADVLALPKTKKEVEEIVAYCREQGLSWLVLGNASNLIVRDGGIRDANRNERNQSSRYHHDCGCWCQAD